MRKSVIALLVFGSTAMTTARASEFGDTFRVDVPSCPMLATDGTTIVPGQGTLTYVAQGSYPNGPRHFHFFLFLQCQSTVPPPGSFVQLDQVSTGLPCYPKFGLALPGDDAGELR